MKKKKYAGLLAAALAAAVTATAIPAGLSAAAAGAEEPDQGNSEVLPVIGTFVGDDYGWNSGWNLLYPDGTLYTVNRWESQKVATDVKSYEKATIGFYGAGNEGDNYLSGTIYVSNYLTLDSDNTLWDWGSTKESGPQGKEKVADDVADYTASAVLLENGDVLNAAHPEDGAMLQGITAISELEYGSCVIALREDSTLWGWDPNYDEGFKQIDTGVSEIIGSDVYIKEHATYRAFWNSKLGDFVAEQVSDNGANYAYIISPEGLYIAYRGEVSSCIGDFKSFLYSGFDGNAWGFTTNGGKAYRFNGIEEPIEIPLPFPMNEIQKLSSEFILKTDGSLWRMTSGSLTRSVAASAEKILDNVADFAGDSSNCLAVGKDGGLWIYNTSLAAFEEVESPVGNTGEPGTTNPSVPTEPSVGGGSDGGDEMPSGGGNSPNTGDSMIALPIAVLAGSAAGALLLLRKRFVK